MQGMGDKKNSKRWLDPQGAVLSKKSDEKIKNLTWNWNQNWRGRSRDSAMGVENLKPQEKTGPDGSSKNFVGKQLKK